LLTQLFKTQCLLYMDLPSIPKSNLHLPTQQIYVFRVTFTINNDYFPE